MKWTKEKCKEISIKYSTKKDFKKKSPYVYKISCKNKWLDDICKHMIENRKSKGYWTKEKCMEEALKYKTKSEFQKNSKSSYIIAYKKGWLEQICQHMEKVGNKKNRCIYTARFNNAVYVGLTYDYNKRINEHLTNKNSVVYQYMKMYDEIPTFYKETDYVDIKMAQFYERSYVEHFEKLNYVILNRTETGALGGNHILWAKEKCREEALKYKTRKSFQINSSSAYKSSLKNGWLDEICSHMIEIHKPKGYWTKEKCKEEALKYKNKTEFRLNSGGAYYFAYKQGWINEICNYKI